MLLIDSFTREKYCYKRLTVWMNIDHIIRLLTVNYAASCRGPWSYLKLVQKTVIETIVLGTIIIHFLRVNIFINVVFERLFDQTTRLYTVYNIYSIFVGFSFQVEYFVWLNTDFVRFLIPLSNSTLEFSTFIIVIQRSEEMNKGFDEVWEYLPHFSWYQFLLLIDSVDRSILNRDLETTDDIYPIPKQ